MIEGPERTLIIDAGWNREECMLAMQASLRQLGVDLKKTDFFVTHGHGDHLGLVPSLATDSSIIYFNQPDAEWLKKAARLGSLIDCARLNGFPEEELQSLPKGSPEYNLPFCIVKEGDTLISGEYRFVCVETPGHTKGHICLYEPEKRVLVAGDHIFDDITPNITLWTDDRNPLKEYLSSLDKVGEYDIELVLPGHRRLIRNCKERILQLKEHHEKRAEQIVGILEKGPQDAFRVASQMSSDITYDSWDFFPLMQEWFATSEAITHLKYLEQEGMILREMQDEKRVFLLNKGAGI